MLFSWFMFKSSSLCLYFVLISAGVFGVYFCQVTRWTDSQHAICQATEQFKPTRKNTFSETGWGSRPKVCEMFYILCSQLLVLYAMFHEELKPLLSLSLLDYLQNLSVALFYPLAILKVHCANFRRRRVLRQAAVGLLHMSELCLWESLSQVV